jgi:acyl carrier protein
MGLDLLDIVFRLERRFDIKITREELFQAFPGADKREFQARRLLDLVINKLPGEIKEVADQPPWDLEPKIDAAAWEWLQSQFPTRGPSDLVPFITARKWREFEMQGVRPPRLGYGRWQASASLLQLAGGLAALAICATSAIALSNLVHDWDLGENVDLLGFMFVFLVPFFVLIGVVYLGVDWLLATQPTARTMSELATELARQNCRIFANRISVKLHREHVWKIIRRELSEVLMIEEEKIYPNSDLIRDLLMD